MVVAIMLMLLASPGVSLAAVSYSADEIEIVRLINEYRVANGLDAVLVSDVLSDASEKHSHDMAKYAFFGHITVSSDWFPTGFKHSERIVACGYPANHSTGENISGGWDTPQSMLTAWKQSESHNLNMLDPKWKVIGIGLVTMNGSPYGTYCTTDFGNFVDGTAHENGGTLPPDTTPPTVTILQPDPAVEVRGTVTVAVDVVDNRGVAHVDLYANGSFVASDTASPYAIAWDSSTVPNGVCTLEVRAYDPSGNKGVATRQVQVTGSSTTSSTSSTTTTTTTTTTTSPTTTSTTTSTTSTTSATGSTTSTTLPGPAHFADVPASHPYYSPIMTLAGMGVICGYEDGMFRPASAVTRAQFTKIIVLALDEHTATIDGAARPTFSDVPYRGVPYPFDYVEEAAALHIITGYSNGTFAPSKNITRLQLAVMLVRAGGDDLLQTPAGYVCPFTDVPAGARADVAAAVFNGIVSGKSAHTFDPYSSATRGQVAQMVYSLCKILQKVQ
jgi:uncharacterized protein YkwD